MGNLISQSDVYILGNAAAELQRLIEQARFFHDLTLQLFRLAGLERGMHILDIGCGLGDVAFLAAEIVGPEGLVIGVDRSPEAIALAQERASAARLTNMRFMVQDVSELILDEPVDAIVGRLILMYLTNPSLVINRLLDNLSPGGTVVFQEMDMEGVKSEPYCEVFETTVERIRQTFMRCGIDSRFGLRLRPILQDAGLPAPQMIQSARVEGGYDSPGYAVMEQMVRTLLPMMEKSGVATADEFGLDTLAERLREENIARDAVMILPPLIGAWSHKF